MRGLEEGSDSIYYYQIFAMRHLAEKACEWNGKLYVVFMDLDKAYKIDKEGLWKVLKMYSKLLNVSFYSDSKAFVREW